jgi:hypothetical protein
MWSPPVLRILLLQYFPIHLRTQLTAFMGNIMTNMTQASRKRRAQELLAAQDNKKPRVDNDQVPGTGDSSTTCVQTM